MKYLKLFEKQTDYQSFVESDSFVTPNVSFAKEENIVFFNPYEEPEKPSIPNNVIMYNASEKLTETKSTSVSGLHTNAFNTTIVSHDFVDGVGTVVFEEDVTSIGYCALYQCPSLTSIVIPGSVTSIGEMAFTYCEGLTSIVIPDSVTSIGDYAFEGCSSLSSVTIGSGVTSIGNYAFVGCSITSITIPDSVTSIGSGAFGSCSSLSSVTIGSGVTSIGEKAFDTSWELHEITYNGYMSQWENINNANWNVASVIECVNCIDGVIPVISSDEDYNENY
jgi:hypothetical protein